ncbi:unnamed protein product [Caenorhabditis nigoni]
MQRKAVNIYGTVCCLLLLVIFYEVQKVSYESAITIMSSSELLGRIGIIKRRGLGSLKLKNSELKLTTNMKAVEPLETLPRTYVSEECRCISNRTGKSYDFCYRNPKNQSLTGKKFNCSFLSTLEDLKLVENADLPLVNLSNKERNEKDVMFVSAISSDHFGNFLQMYNLLKRHWPKQKVLLYSLDLSDTQIKKLKEDENIEIRKFNYKKYPKYVENWAEYRFKALILAEAIREFPNIWWTDSHNRWLEPKPLAMFYEEIAKCQGDVDCDKKSSIMMFVNSTHSNYAVLTEGLLDYFPTFNMDTLKYNDKGLQLSAAFVYLARTPFTLEILKWHTLCALEEKCMNPPNAKLKCDSTPEWDKYAGCFRYDQSSLNLLMFNSFRNHNNYFMNVGKVTRTYDHY